MARKVQYLTTNRDTAVEFLKGIRQSGRQPTHDEWTEAIATSGYSRRQLDRLSRGPKEDRPEATGFVVDEQVVSALFMTVGNMSSAHRLLINEFGRTDLPGPRQFARAINSQIDTLTLAYARHGSSGARDAKIYLATEQVPRNHTWELDHTELPIYVIPHGTKTPVRPWITGVLDRATRYPLAWILTFGRPSSQQVTAVLAQAITLRYGPDGQTVVGGKPLRCVWDRGLEFLSTSVSEACISLGIIPLPLPAYSPHLKPHIERSWRFMKEDFLPPLPGYTDKIADLRGASAIASSCLEEAEFMLKLADWIDWYITERPHSTLKCTPLEAWKSYPTEQLDIIENPRLWEFFLSAKHEVKVSKNGIRFDTIDFTASELTGYVGRKVTIRYLPHDRTFVEVFIGGRHICTAYPRLTLTAEQEQEVILHRQQVMAAARARFSTANRLRRESHQTTTTISRNSKGKMVVTSQERDNGIDLLSGAEEALARITGAGEINGQGTLL